MRIKDFCTIVVVVGLLLLGSAGINSAYAVVAFEGEINDFDADFGFANVGIKGSLTAVYLGDRWVLTAKHVGAGNLVLDGITYQYEEGSAKHVPNPVGYNQLDSQYTDLTLYRLTEEPDLPALNIAKAPPAAGTELYLAGNGDKRQDSLSHWNLNTGDWSWEESETPTQYWGYKTEGSRELSWGRNQVIASSHGPTDSTYYLTLGNCDMVAIKTKFDAQEPREAQAVSGDSGGGAFYFDEEEGWVLAGIISCIEILPHAPTYAFAGSTTCCVDLSFYRNTILNIIGANTIPTNIPGDANGDGVVDGNDVTILASNWQQTGHPATLQGDFNGDGIVNGADVTILASNWQDSSSTMQACDLMADSNSAEAPEPATWILLLSAAGSFAIYLCKNRTRR